MAFAKRACLFLIIYFCFMGAFFWIIHDDWSQTSMTNDPVNKDALLAELNDNCTIKQTLDYDCDVISSIELFFSSLDSEKSDKTVTVSLLCDNEAIYSHMFDLSGVLGDGSVVVELNHVEEVRNHPEIDILLQGNGGILFWYGSSRNAGKFDVTIDSNGKLFYGDKLMPGELVMRMNGIRLLPYSRYYWPTVIILAVCLLLVITVYHQRKLRGQPNLFDHIERIIRSYKYLLKTLVIRDFKVRYKASVLGVVWSFLNPLLMTFVYLFVFSTIFQSSIPYFVVYLMSGIILYNYFSEATNLGLQSIIGNAGLITKVYIPKYIFPISKAISSSINMVISMIPLFIMMAITGVPFRKSLLLIPFVIANIIVFSIGVSLILSAIAVFFRDIQFLWTIALTVLNFFSPIFYPESIIPVRFIKVYHINPIYQYLYFLRTITIGGISPSFMNYIYCVLASLSALLFGLWIFRKMQDKFILYL